MPELPIDGNCTTSLLGNGARVYCILEGVKNWLKTLKTLLKKKLAYKD